VKRRDLVRHLEAHGCEMLREGGSHSVYVNRIAGKATAVPRHRELNEFLAQKILRDLDVPPPWAGFGTPAVYCFCGASRCMTDRPVS
jgi:predicted RNA binding protein YcfA (HicA-like mRNA interferase family)